MSSRSADAAVDAGRRRRAAARWSITTRLTLLYTLSAFGMLAAVTTLLYSILVRGMERDDRFLLADKVYMLQATLRFHGDDLTMLDHEMYVQGDGYKPNQHYIYYCRVLDDAGRLLIETPDMHGLIPASQFPPPAEPAKAWEAEAPHHWRSPDRRSYLLMSVWARSGSDVGPRRIIQVALDGTEEAALLADYRRNSLVALAFGTLLFAAFGVLVARQGMRPLQAIARPRNGSPRASCASASTLHAGLGSSARSPMRSITC